MDSKHSEDVCNRCGKCCLFGIRISDSGMAFNSIACKYLEKDGKHTKCRVYPSRMKMAPWCMSVDEAICKGELPPDCPYVPENYGFKGRYILDPIIEGAVINIFKDMIKPLIDDGRIKFRRT